MPRVSVVVPVRNEEAALARLLDSLAGQSLPPDEIVLADGGSTDGTVRVAEGFKAQGVRVLEIGPAFPGRGRNRAIAAARNDWLALIDAGCEADPRWLERLVEPVAADPNGVRVVFGRYEPRVATEWDLAQAFGLLPPVDPALGTRGPSTASCLLHRSAWTAAGEFPEHLRAAEDHVFFEGLRKAGIASVFRPEAVVHWSLAPTPGAVFRRFRVYSSHHAAAGLAHTWHHRVMAMDVAGLGLVLGGMFYPPLLALAGAAALARLLHTVRGRRGNAPASSPYRPLRLARVAWLLALADAATWAGLFDNLRGRGARA